MEESEVCWDCATQASYSILIQSYQNSSSKLQPLQSAPPEPNTWNFACKINLKAGAKSARLLCFGLIIHATVRLYQVWGPWLSDKHVGTRANHTRTKSSECQKAWGETKLPLWLKNTEEAVRFSWHVQRRTGARFELMIKEGAVNPRDGGQPTFIVCGPKWLVSLCQINETGMLIGQRPFWSFLLN